jgi:hypothetical protein
VREIVKRTLTRGATKSCGCLQREAARRLTLQQRIYTGKESAARKVLYRYRTQSKERKLEFNIDYEHFIKLTSGDCFYCGEPPSRISTTNNNLEGEYIFNGIDRVDNNKGYIEGNIVSCCKVCNYMKRTMTKEEFLSMCEKVYNTHRKELTDEDIYDIIVY